MSYEHNLCWITTYNLYSGRSPSREKLDKLINDHDKDGNGTIGRFNSDKVNLRLEQKAYDS